MFKTDQSSLQRYQSPFIAWKEFPKNQKKLGCRESCWKIIDQMNPAIDSWKFLDQRWIGEAYVF